MRTLTKIDFKDMPWKNGGGTTTELIRYPDDGPLLFRLSIATVAVDGPFSLFPGMERLLKILEGEGIVLELMGLEQTLTKESPVFSFRGEETIFCRLITGGVRDFNVMVDRSWGKACFQNVTDPEGVSAYERLFFYRTGELQEFLRGESFYLEGDYIEVKIERIHRTPST